MDPTQGIAHGHAIEMAALTRTLIPSSTVDRIFYAKVCRERADVLFVKARSFTINEVDQDANIKLLTAQEDLDGIIVSSLVLPETSTDHAQIGDHSDAGGEFRGEGHELPTQTYRLPPQIIVFALQRGLERTLQFVFGYHDRQQTIRFAIRGYPLMSMGQNTMGTSMAVDPHGRLLAVAAQMSIVSIFKLKTWPEIRQQVEQDGRIDDTHFDPLVENMQMEIKGCSIILHMDFVTPPDDERDTSFLAIIANGRHGRVFTSFKIDCNRPLKQIRPIYSISLGLPDFPGLDNSLFIIPLKHYPGLFVCAEKHLALVLDIRKPQFELQPSYLGDKLTEAVNDPTGQTQPLYTIWCRPISQDILISKSRQDTIYLCREDGQIKVLRLISEAGKKPKLEVAVLGHLHHQVDQAFTAIKVPYETAHQTFISAGNYCNGVVATVVPKRAIQLRSIIPLDYSIIDYTVIPDLSNDLNVRGRIFGTSSSNTTHGTLSELRRGATLRILEEFPFETDDSVKITCLSFQNVTYLVMYAMNGTARVHEASSELADDSKKQEKAASGSMPSNQKMQSFFVDSVQNNDRVIATEFLKGRCYVVVTSMTIRKISADWSESISLIDDNVTDHRILDARIDCLHSKVLYVIARANALELRLLDVGNDPVQYSKSHFLDTEPSTMCLFTDDDYSLAIISTQSGNLDFYGLHGFDLKLQKTYNLHPIDGVCEDVVVLKHTRTGSRSYKVSLLCGLRSGYLKILDVQLRDEDMQVSERDSVCLGFTSVHIVVRHWNSIGTENYTAIIYCDQSCYVYQDTGHRFTGSTLKRLWFLDSCAPRMADGDRMSKGCGLYQTEILSIAAAMPLDLDHRTVAGQAVKKHRGDEDLFCMTRTGIRRCQIDIDEEPRSIPWQMPVGGNPVRVIWSQHHKRLIVGIHIDLVVDRSPQARKRDSKRTTFAAIKILNPSPPESDSIDSSGSKQVGSPYPVTGPATEQGSFAAIVDPSGERISALAEWQVTARGKRYHMLLVSTLERIRLYNYQAADGPLELKVTVHDQSKEAILDIAVYDSTSFVTLTLASIVMYRIEEKESSSKTNFRQVARIALGSKRGSRSIHVKETQIVVGTQHHGIQIFEFNNDTFQHRFSDTAGGLVSDTITLTRSRSPLSDQLHPGFTNLHISAYHSPGVQGDGARETQSLISASYSPPCQPQSKPIPLEQLFVLTLHGQVTRVRELPQPTATSQVGPNLRSRPQPRKILLSTLTGTIHSLTLLPLPTFKILSLLTRLIEDERQTLCPFRLASANTRSSHGIVLPHPESNIRERHVDGDILMRLLTSHDRDETRILAFVRSLISQEYISHSGPSTDDSPDYRNVAGGDRSRKVHDLEPLFRELLGQILGPDGVERAGGIAEACSEVVRTFVDC